MHEVGIMESALEVVLAQAREHGATRVHKIIIRLGELSGVDPESLRFAFEAVTSETPAAGARLEIETVSALARCPECQRDFGVSSGYIFTCPHCGQLSGDIRQGRELELARLEMS